MTATTYEKLYTEGGLRNHEAQRIRDIISGSQGSQRSKCNRSCNRLIIRGDRGGCGPVGPIPSPRRRLRKNVVVFTSMSRAKE